MTDEIMYSTRALRHLNPSILLADRDPILADTVRQILDSRGHIVRTCTCGAECLKLLQELSPVVLVLDAGLLRGEGEGVVDWLASDESLLPQMVVIASDGQLPDLPDRLEPWIDLHIPRPVSMDQLHPFVNQLETLIWWSSSPESEATKSRLGNHRKRHPKTNHPKH